MADRPVGRWSAARTAVATGVGLAVGAGAWTLGLDLPHATAAGLAALGLAAALGGLGRSPDPRWPEPPDVEVSRGWHGAGLTARLLEQLDAEPDRIPRLLLPRLRAVVAPRLATLGHDPRSAAARTALGSELHDLLGVRDWPREAPGATELTARVLERADELAAARVPTAPSASPGRRQGRP